MVAVGEGIFDLFAQERRADGQSAAQTLGRGDDVRFEAVDHVGVELAAAAVASLHLVDAEEHVLFAAEGLHAAQKVAVQRAHAALALHHFQHHGAGVLFLAEGAHAA